MTDAQGRVRLRWHAPTATDWKAVELAYGEGGSERELERKFGICRSTIGTRRRKHGWPKELSEEAREALREEVRLGALERPVAPRRVGSRRGPRWGRNGGDWLAMELDFSIGKSVRDIAKDHGFSKHTVERRARREAWRRDLPDDARNEMLRRVTAVDVAADLRAERLDDAGKRLRAIKTMKALAPRTGKAEARMDERDLEELGAELYRELEKRLRRLERSVEHKTADGNVPGRGAEAIGAGDRHAAVAPAGPRCPDTA